MEEICDYAAPPVDSADDEYRAPEIIDLEQLRKRINGSASGTADANGQGFH